MFNSAKNLKCRKLNYEFGKTIEVDIKKITTSKDILVKADITTNYYQIPKDDYNRMLIKKLKEEYIKCHNSIIDEINTEAFEIATKLKLDDRIIIFQSSPWKTSTAKCNKD